MKKSIFISVVSICLLNSCLKTNDPTIPVFIYGIYDKQGSDYYILCDDGEKDLLINATKPDSTIGNRFYVEGNLQMNAPAGYAAIVKVIRMEQVLVCSPQMLANQSAVNNLGMTGIDFEPAKMMSYWGKYVNIMFNYVATDVSKHTFSYAIDTSTEKFNTNKVTIYLRHSKGNDDVFGDKKQLEKCFTSLDLTDIFNKMQSKKFTLVIKYINIYDSEQETTCEVENTNM